MTDTGKMEKARRDLLITCLDSKDGAVREAARNEIVTLGRDTIPQLAEVLRDSKSEQARWEAAKAFGTMDNTAVILPLVEALEDGFSDVAWLAASGLKKYGRKAWGPILRRLMRKGTASFSLRQGAHHVFMDQKEEGLNGLLSDLTKTLEIGTAPELMIPAALELLKGMKKNMPASTDQPATDTNTKQGEQSC